jgi:hypothetical protein
MWWLDRLFTPQKAPPPAARLVNPRRHISQKPPSSAEKAIRHPVYFALSTIDPEKPSTKDNIYIDAEVYYFLDDDGKKNYQVKFNTKAETFLFIETYIAVEWSVILDDGIISHDQAFEFIKDLECTMERTYLHGIEGNSNCNMVLLCALIQISLEVLLGNLRDSKVSPSKISRFYAQLAALGPRFKFAQPESSGRRLLEAYSRGKINKNFMNLIRRSTGMLDYSRPAESDQ